MSRIFIKFVLTISATWCFVIVYYLNKMVKLDINVWLSTIQTFILANKVKFSVLLFFTIVMVIAPIFISKQRCFDEMSKASLIELADNTYIPTYLGYFFVGMSLDNFIAMIGFYLIILTFTFLSSIEYFNPIFLFMGYHIYKVESSTGVQNILILKSKDIIRSSEELTNLKLYRINNLTYIGKAI